jgi:RsiW-degrading membrane proteinase PrsW (M82 family)
MTPCEHCGRDTPDQAFCVWCGAHRTAAIGNPQTRHHSYAAHPGEHVAQPSTITTLFPHLPRERVHEFRWSLLGGLAVVVVLVATGLIVAAILAAAVLVPVLYLVYLYEAQVYRDEPAQVLGLTIGAGVVLGIIVTIIADHLTSSSVLLEVHESVGLLLGTTLLLPVIQEVIKPLPVLVLRRRPAFQETIDGLVFGVALGLGFTAAQTIVDFSKVIADQPVHATSASWIFPVLSIAVLNPLLQGSCTGVITASLWRIGRGRRPAIAVLAIPLAIVAHVAFSLVAQVLSNHGVSPAIVIGWQVLVIIPVLVYIRFLVHHTLLEEAEDFGFHEATCPNCHRHVATAAFCPECGAAMSAGPRIPAADLTPADPTPAASAPAGTPGGDTDV